MKGPGKTGRNTGPILIGIASAVGLGIALMTAQEQRVKASTINNRYVVAGRYG